MKFLAYLIEFICWLSIVTSSMLSGAFIGGILILIYDSKVTLIIAAVLAFIGLIFGIFWAKRIRKKMTYSTFASKIMATPELDIKTKGEQKRNK